MTYLRKIFTYAFAFLAMGLFATTAHAALDGDLNSDVSVALVGEEVTYTVTVTASDGDGAVSFSGAVCGSGGTVTSSELPGIGEFVCTYSTAGPKTATVTLTQDEESDTVISSNTVTIQANSGGGSSTTTRRTPRRSGGFAPGHGPNAAVDTSYVTFDGMNYDIDSLTEEEKQNLIRVIVDRIVEIALQIINMILEVVRDEYADNPQDAAAATTTSIQSPSASMSDREFEQEYGWYYEMIVELGEILGADEEAPALADLSQEERDEIIMLVRGFEESFEEAMPREAQAAYRALANNIENCTPFRTSYTTSERDEYQNQENVTEMEIFGSNRGDCSYTITTEGTSEWHTLPEGMTSGGRGTSRSSQQCEVPRAELRRHAADLRDSTTFEGYSKAALSMFSMFAQMFSDSNDVDEDRLADFVPSTLRYCSSSTSAR